MGINHTMLCSLLPFSAKQPCWAGWMSRRSRHAITLCNTVLVITSRCCQALKTRSGVVFRHCDLGDSPVCWVISIRLCLSDSKPVKFKCLLKFGFSLSITCLVIDVTIYNEFKLKWLYINKNSTIMKVFFLCLYCTAHESSRCAFVLLPRKCHPTSTSLLSEAGCVTKKKTIEPCSLD